MNLGSSRPPLPVLSTMYDTAAIAPVPALLEPLGLRPCNNSLTVRVTKKFPELFTAWLKTVRPDIKLSLDAELPRWLQRMFRDA